MRNIFFFVLLAAFTPLGAQEKAPENWFNLSYQTEKVRGVQTERTYNELIKDKKGKTVIVAVIDGGIDNNHEDLKDMMWKNPGEIADNKIDDDKNGYIDDVYGWNFLGNQKGENIRYEQTEFTRLYKKLKPKYDGKLLIDVPATSRMEFELYEKVRGEYNKQLTDMKKNKVLLDTIVALVNDIKAQRKTDSATFADFKAYQPSDAFKKLHFALKIGIKDEKTWNEAIKEIKTGKEQIDASINHHLNLDFNPRSLVGDDPENPNERYYGNNDVKGPDALHGTHVAGIIAASRNNNIGIKGVAADVRIMAIRAVPDGDERDKDIANAIRYAVDNGAQIINMSFGKSYGTHKEAVDEAVKYAESKGVLLVHAAGNDGKNNDNTDNFPSDTYKGGGSPNNWIEVGALSWKDGKRAVAPFSNYGKTEVDVFAPGVAINSCKTNGGYTEQSGTSMASPVCTGVCAVLKAYYPDLTPAQIKTIIENSSDKSLAKKKVITPGTKKKKIKFGKLCKTGGFVNLYEAFKLAETTK
ncbi:MAG: subtilisin-like serine protease [Bacteroidetes bacterium]|nr:MAG: subtilisin-like serine protease [Bacteroidota bacterium]